jgi:hypothetical protein
VVRGPQFGKRWIMSMKNSRDNIGNRIRSLPACSAETQPTAPPRALHPEEIIQHFPVCFIEINLTVLRCDVGICSFLTEKESFPRP